MGEALRRATRGASCGGVGGELKLNCPVSLNWAGLPFELSLMAAYIMPQRGVYSVTLLDPGDPG